MKSMMISTFLAMVCAVATPLAHAAGDPAHGESVYQEECSDCHSVAQGKNKKGPSLFGIVGRKAASIADFKYSDAMRASGRTWTAEAINEYIQAPKKMVPGGRMKYDGLDDPAARDDVIAFLSTLH